MILSKQKQTYFLSKKIRENRGVTKNAGNNRFDWVHAKNWDFDLKMSVYVLVTKSQCTVANKASSCCKKTCETTALHLIQMQCIFLQLLLPAFYISCTLECPLHARIKGGGKIALLFHHCTVVGFVKKMAENQHKAYWYSSWWFLC